MDASHFEAACILVVEDECFIRMDSAAILINAGYIVIEAGSADEAIAILEMPSNVQLLFSDIDMPGSINGLQLAALVHTRWPAIPVLLTSGGSFIPDTQLHQNNRFVSKPYSSATVISNVSDLLSVC